MRQHIKLSFLIISVKISFKTLRRNMFFYSQQTTLHWSKHMLWKGVNFYQCLVCTKHFEIFLNLFFKPVTLVFFFLLRNGYATHRVVDVTFLHTLFFLILHTSKSNLLLKNVNFTFFFNQSTSLCSFEENLGLNFYHILPWML